MLPNCILKMVIYCFILFVLNLQTLIFNQNYNNILGHYLIVTIKSTGQKLPPPNHIIFNMVS